MPLPWLDAEHIAFPPAQQALTEPNGLLAAGGELTPEWLLCAYRQGIFPWYESGQPILWWSPDPRLVLLPEQLRVSRSLRRLLNKQRFTVSFDRQFAAVVAHCAEPREGSSGTWITSAMQRAYCELHELGLAHSVEVWEGADLVGGLYGVALGRVFFGESMFSRRANCSKIALVYLARHLQRWDFELIDCQVNSEHLLSLGASPISRELFLSKLAQLVPGPNPEAQWQVDDSLSAKL